MALNPQQEKFVLEYLKDMNATQAAIRAGYSSNNADVTGPRLLGNVRIAAAVADALEERSKATKIDAQYVLKRLHDENEADLADLYDADTGALLPVHKWPLIWRKGLVQGVDVEELREEGATIGVVRKVKISDRIKRTELIGKHVDVQAFADKLDVSVTDNLAERLARAKARANGGE
jgi:phage terminase small subunit